MLELITADIEPASARIEANKKWMLRLYIAGQTPRSVSALANLRKICEQFVPDRYLINVIDLLIHPQLAKGDQIVAIPTLVRDFPEPIRKIIGELSNTERVLIGLDIVPGAN